MIGEIKQEASEYDTEESEPDDDLDDSDSSSSYSDYSYSSSSSIISSSSSTDWSGVAAIATMLYWSYLLPCLILKTQSIFTPNLDYDIGNSPAMFAPVANWLFVGLNVLMIPFSASHVGLEFIGYIFGWGLAGLVLLLFIK